MIIHRLKEPPRFDRYESAHPPELRHGPEAWDHDPFAPKTSYIDVANTVQHRHLQVVRGEAHGLPTEWQLKQKRVFPEPALDETLRDDTRTQKQSAPVSMRDEEIRRILLSPYDFFKDFFSEEEHPFGTGCFQRRHFGKSLNGKHIIVQNGLGGSFGACYGMIAVDHGKQPDHILMGGYSQKYSAHLFRGAADDAEILIPAFQKLGMTATRHFLRDLSDSDGQHVLQQLAKAVAGGPVIVKLSGPIVSNYKNVKSEELYLPMGESEEDGVQSVLPMDTSLWEDVQSHSIILDELNLEDDYAVIRDPYHGWIVVIKPSSLLGRINYENDYYLSVSP